MLLTLINHPTPSFTLLKKEPEAEPLYLGNVYRRTMPVSLARVASVLEAVLNLDVDILDLKAIDPGNEIAYKTVDLGDRIATVKRSGGAFEKAQGAIARSDWIGLSNHFTFESGIIRDLIA